MRLRHLIVESKLLFFLFAILLLCLFYVAALPPLPPCGVGSYLPGECMPPNGNTTGTTQPNIVAPPANISNYSSSPGPQYSPPSVCTANSDCYSNVCNIETGECASPSCADFVKNGLETDIDCGGNCNPCEDSLNCTRNADCISSSCYLHVCISCSDGIKNGLETDVDCGGSCNACVPLQEEVPVDDTPYVPEEYVDNSGQGYVDSGTPADIVPVSTTTTTLLQAPAAQSTFPAYLAYLIIFGVVFVLAMGVLTFVNTLHILSMKNQQVAQKLEKPELKPSSIESASSLSSAQQSSKPESVSSQPSKKIPIEELQTLKSFVEKCHSSDIGTPEIRKALLEKGWDPSLVDMALE